MGTLVFSEKKDKIMLRLAYPFRIISLIASILVLLGMVWKINYDLFMLYFMIELILLFCTFYRESYTITEDGVVYRIGWAFIIKKVEYKANDIERFTYNSFYKGYQSGFIPPKDNPKKVIFKKKYTKFTRLEMHLLDGEVKVVELIKDNKIYQLDSKVNKINNMLGK